VRPRGRLPRAAAAAGRRPKTASRALDAIAAAAEPADAFAAFAPPAACAVDWLALAALFRALRERRRGWPAELSEMRRWYEPQMARLHENAQARLADLAALEAIAAPMRRANASSPN